MEPNSGPGPNSLWVKREALIDSRKTPGIHIYAGVCTRLATPVMQNLNSKGARNSTGQRAAELDHATGPKLLGAQRRIRASALIASSFADSSWRGLGLWLALYQNLSTF